MARKDNTKAKEKKKERKLLEQRMNAGWANVKEANSQENPLSALPSFQTFNKNDLKLNLETTGASNLDKDTKEYRTRNTCLELIYKYINQMLDY